MTQRLASSIPVRGDQPPTLASLLRGLAHCEHPEGERTPAIALEPDGSKVSLLWCGACGALDLKGRRAGDWLRPGFAQLLGDSDCLQELACDLAARAEKVVKLAGELREACATLGPASESKRAVLLTTVLELEMVCASLRRLVRSELGEVRG